MCNKTLTRSTVIYNRKAGKNKYQVIDPFGVIVNDFPSGQQGKRAAELEALRVDDQKAYDEAHHLRYNVFNLYAETHSRIWKAARIVADKAVYSAHPLGPNAGEAYHVKSQSRKDFYYTVSRPDDFYTCTCLDFDEFHAPTVHGQKLCKHIFAVKMLKALKRPFPAYLDSPRDLWRHLEETGASYKVLGAWNRRPYLYARPQQRPAVAGEIVEDAEGKTWRIVQSGQKFNLWRVDLPAQLKPARTASEAAAAQVADMSFYELEKLDRAIAASKAAPAPWCSPINSKRAKLAQMDRERAEKRAVEAYRQQKAAAVNAELFG